MTLVPGYIFDHGLEREHGVWTPRIEMVCSKNAVILLSGKIFDQGILEGDHGTWTLRTETVLVREGRQRISGEIVGSVASDQLNRFLCRRVKSRPMVSCGRSYRSRQTVPCPVVRKSPISLLLIKDNLPTRAELVKKPLKCWTERPFFEGVDIGSDAPA